jgi:hypothetical protein
MDPHLFDLIWDVYREVEATEPIAIVCGYRSPAPTPCCAPLEGVAKFSQHMLGKAMDFYIPGVPLEKLREAGLRASRGGVGFYPSSNFVHLDTGSVRHWPRMPEAELAKVMAKGPITAVASRKTDTKVASASARIPNPFAKLFGIRRRGRGGRRDGRRDCAGRAHSRGQEARSESHEKVGWSGPPWRLRPPSPPRTTRPAQPQPGSFDLASTSSRPVELRPARATGLVNSGDTSANAVISERGYWQASPDNSAQMSAAAKSAAALAAARVATADPTGTTPWPAPDRAATGSALAYAPAAHPASPARPASAPTAATPARTAQAAPTPQRDTTVAVKRGAEPQPAQAATAPTTTTAQTLAAALAQAKAGQQFNDPWMRAMIGTERGCLERLASARLTSARSAPICRSRRHR